MHSVYVEFGRLLRNQREKEGLTQQDIADKVGLSRTSITNIELGRQNISLALLFKIAAATNTSPAKLLPDAKFALEDDPLSEALGRAQLDESAKGWIKKIASS